MLLAIDSGNTNTVFAVLNEDGTTLEQWRSSTDIDKTADEYGIWLEQLMQLAGLNRIVVSDAIIATVVPSTLYSLKTLCRKYFNCEPLIIGEEGVQLDIKIQVDQPDDVGEDRLVNSLAAHQYYGGPLIIIDFGTATTFDVIDDQGSYLGGIIAPGVNLSTESLHQAAAQLPRVIVKKPSNVIGKATVPAIQSGIFWGYVSMIEGLVHRIQEEMGLKMDVIATGGLAELFTEECKVIKLADNELTMRGLFLIFRRNKP